MINDILSNKGYSVGQVIGEGAFGKIYLAKSENQTKQVAIKKLNKSESDFVYREVEAALSLKHENIIEVYDVFETKKHIYIVMELAEGGDLLEKMMKCGTFSDAESKRVFREIVNAVAYSHSQNVAHRDIKLENILLSSDGQVKLCDFGFARKIEKSQLSETFCGSASYCPPEVLLGKAYNSFGVDIWSLGVVLFALVNGGLPFEDSNIHQMVSSQLNKELPFAGEVDSQCLALIESMLEPDTEKRATIEEIMNSSWLQ